MKTELTLLLEGLPMSCNQFLMGTSNCFMIQAGGKKILFGTGPYSERVFLLAKLKSLSITARDIDILVLPQLHYDTAINLDLFSNARICVHKNELDFAISSPEKDVAMPRFLGRMVQKLTNLEVIQEETELAVGVKIVELPGQTPGSIGLLVEDTLLAGGAVPTIRAAKQRDIYPCYYSPELALKSLDKALGMAEKIYPGYDRCFCVSDFTPLTEVGMRLRLFFSPSGHDQEYSIRSEEQKTFANWPPHAQLQANPTK